MFTSPDAPTDEYPMRVLQIDQLRIEIYPDRHSLGTAAAHAVARAMREALAQKDQIFMAFAAAPSQNEFLAILASIKGLDWPRVATFQLDEYVGLSPDKPQRFANFLQTHLYRHVNPGLTHFLDGNARSLDGECDRYSKLLECYPLDIACIGVGQNGHIAFNEPGEADFSDDQMVRIVDLDPGSRMQQVQDGCFARVEEVPRSALTLSIPAIVKSAQIYCIVPGSHKAQAIRDTLRSPISSTCPASILRRHQQATLYLDQEAAAGV